MSSGSEFDDDTTRRVAVLGSDSTTTVVDVYDVVFDAIVREDCKALLLDVPHGLHDIIRIETREKSEYLRVAYVRVTWVVAAFTITKDLSGFYITSFVPTKITLR